MNNVYTNIQSLSVSIILGCVEVERFSSVYLIDQDSQEEFDKVYWNKKVFSSDFFSCGLQDFTIFILFRSLLIYFTTHITLLELLNGNKSIQGLRHTCRS